MLYLRLTIRQVLSTSITISTQVSKWQFVVLTLQAIAKQLMKCYAVKCVKWKAHWQVMKKLTCPRCVWNVQASLKRLMSSLFVYQTLLTRLIWMSMLKSNILAQPHLRLVILKMVVWHSRLDSVKPTLWEQVIVLRLTCPVQKHRITIISVWLTHTLPLMVWAAATTFIIVKPS